MPGEYCPQCGDKEKCAACGEEYHKAQINFMNDVKNYICNGCIHDYKCVANYIKPLRCFPSREGSAVALGEQECVELPDYYTELKPNS